MSNSLEIFDSEAATQRAGGDEDLAKELFEMLLSELSLYHQKIGDLYKEGDYDHLLESVHKLNGATRYTGVPALSEAANQFEQALRKNNNGRYIELSNNLLSEIQRLDDAYQEK